MPIFGKGAEGPLPPRRSAAIVYPPRGGGRSYYVVLCRTVLVLYDTLYDTVRRVVHPRRVGPRRLVRHCTTRRTLPTRRAPTLCTDAPTRRTMHFRQHSEGEPVTSARSGLSLGIPWTSLRRQRRGTTRLVLFFWVRPLVNWQSPLTKRYSRGISESGIRAVQCYDGPTAPLWERT